MCRLAARHWGLEALPLQLRAQKALMLTRSVHKDKVLTAVQENKRCLFPRTIQNTLGAQGKPGLGKLTTTL